MKKKRPNRFIQLICAHRYKVSAVTTISNSKWQVDDKNKFELYRQPIKVTVWHCDKCGKNKIKWEYYD